MPDEDRLLAAHRLRLAAEACAVAGAFRKRGVDYVLIKGFATERAICGPGETRAFHDLDFLVGPDDVHLAEAALQAMGYRPVHGDADRGELSVHAVEYQRNGMIVDLHHEIAGIPTSRAVWSVWRDHGRQLVVAGCEVLALDETASVLVIAVEALRNVARGGTAEELSRALGAQPDHIWQRAWRLAQQSCAEGLLVLALRLTPEGMALIDRCRLVANPSAADRLVGSGATLTSGFVRLAQADALSRKVAIVARELFPTPAGLRYWRPAAGRSTPRLVLYYLYRPLYLAAHVPSAASAYLRAVLAHRRGASG